LTQWAPTHGGLQSQEVADSSLSYFAASQDWLVVMRTIYGGPEGSDRGGLQVVTRILAVRPEQLAAYDNHPLRLARTAWIVGGLRLENNYRNLAPLDLPDRCLRTDPWPEPADMPQRHVLDKVALWLHQRERVALLGAAATFQDLAYVLGQLTRDERRWVSWTTGLKPSVQRPFRLHLFPTREPATRSQLTAQGVTCVDRDKGPAPQPLAR
jgi:hypothetical protein